MAKLHRQRQVYGMDAEADLICLQLSGQANPQHLSPHQFEEFSYRFYSALETTKGGLAKRQTARH